MPNLVVLEAVVLAEAEAKALVQIQSPVGTGQDKTFTTSPSGKITPQETTQAPKQTTPSSSSSSSSSNNPQNNLNSNSNLVPTFLVEAEVLEALEV